MTCRRRASGETSQLVLQFIQFVRLVLASSLHVRGASFRSHPLGSLLLSGSGDVIQPSDGILCAGSGGGYALAAARALIAHTDLSAGEIVRSSLGIAGGIDIYTNGHLTVEELPSES